MPRRKLSDEPIYYVYALGDPRTGEIFYIGKGKRKRAFDHVRLVRANRGVNDAKCARIREILDAGLEVAITKFAEGLTEGQAYGLEAQLIGEQKDKLTNGVTTLLETVRHDHAQVARWCNAFRWCADDWVGYFVSKHGRPPARYELEAYSGIRTMLLSSLWKAKKELKRYEAPEKQTGREG